MSSASEYSNVKLNALDGANAILLKKICIELFASEYLLLASVFPVTNTKFMYGRIEYIINSLANFYFF